jgi:outer membrane protein assembly factor BamE (lipoprotein component of BamABCDE complex)
MRKDNVSSLAVSFAVAVLLVAGAGCAGIDIPKPQEVLKEPLGQGSLRVGMTKDEVISLWGKPDEVRTAEDKERWKGTREVWVYHAQMAAVPVDADYLSRTKKLYFDGDYLTNIGDKE